MNLAHHNKIVKLPILGKPFTPPLVEEVMARAKEIGLPMIEAEKMWHYYESQGWKVGRTPMQQWRSALAGWKLRWQEREMKSKRRQETVSPNVQMVMWQKELERVEGRMKAIKASYGDHQSWDERDRKLFPVLRTRRDELLKALGMMI
jgi:hypothetical protein